ncbi:MAG: CDP-alcohol phosphatidyltransferase family protein [Proteobacteria bacterium]|nr:CDP-alcohol phosphatidyltransferase family protein [Pseudomonadota bacterium]
MPLADGPPRPAVFTPPQRPRELEDWLNFHIYHPLAWRLARLLAPTGISPNMVSVLGAVAIWLAALAYAQPWWPVSALLGMLLHMSWHVIDGADGDLARITGKASPIGEMVDGICDYVGHIVLYLVLGWLLARQVPAGTPAWGPWALMLLAAASHIAQSNHVEVHRRAYQWWVYAKPWLRTSHARADAPTRGGILGAFAAYYLSVAGSVAGDIDLIDAELARAGDDPARRAVVAEAARAECIPLMPLLNLLGPNPRAPVLGIAMLLGSPAWFFVWQVVVLNLLLAWSIHLHKAASVRMLARIRANG